MKIEISPQASINLSNLFNTAINTSLISDTDSTDDLGSTTIAWANLYVDTISSITGNALALTPISGQSLTVNLATTGDFVINTSQLVVDTSAGNVGIGTASPQRTLDVSSSGKITFGDDIVPDNAQGIYFYTGTDYAIYRSPGAWVKPLNFNFSTGINFWSSTTGYAFTFSGGNVGIGITSTTAVLHLKAGTATASTAPIKLTSGVSLTTPEAGAIEFTTDSLYFTITTGPTRKTIAFLESPSFTTPNLGTPSAGVLTNCTGLPVSSLTSGTLAGVITLGEGADPATIGIVMDSSMSADERYSGITVPGTAGATLAFGDLCYLDVTAAEWLLADASAAATAGDVPLGICVDASTDGAATSMLLIGTVRSAAFPASIALGAPVYVSETAGDLTATAPVTTDSVMRRCGWAMTVEPNTIYFSPSNDYTTHV